MGFADVLTIAHAAEVFGVPRDALLGRLDRGGLPEAVHHEGDWCVPADALASIAAREGWPLDLDARAAVTTAELPTVEPGPSRAATTAPAPAIPSTRPDGRRRSGRRLIDDEALELVTGPEGQDTDTVAAHAAVVLAKTQAAAARAEASDLGRRVRRLRADLETERERRAQLEAQLAAASRAQAILERDRAVAEARADELRRQVEQERLERSMLADRLGALEADREEAITSMDRWSRRRYERRQQLSKASRPPKWIQNLTDNQR